METEGQGRKKRITKKLLHKYRLVILNEDTFEERFALKLSRLNVFVIGGCTTIVLIALTTVLIAFTPLREYIPGYSSTKLKKRATHLVYKTDSLQQVVRQKNKYFASIKKVLTGDSVQPATDSLSQADRNTRNPDTVEEGSVKASKAEKDLREEVEKEEKYRVSTASQAEADLDFFSPVNGRVTDGFDAENNHLAIDIATKKDAPVKAVADGVVIFAEWTAETGHVLIIEHQFGFISVYKHNSSLVKRQGEMVKSGEVIAMTGSTGKFTTGTHLHFELWNDGMPLDPENFVDFE